jgi:hypothetical protein
MKLWQYVGKNVRIILHNGHVYEGVAHEYTSALDNEPEIASICIGHTEILETEVKTIELI